MSLLFVTGSDRAFFNSLLVCLQSFAERMPSHRLHVCDFGLTDAQAAFLGSLDLLLPRPPDLARAGVFHAKACLARYLERGGLPSDDMVIWLDADLTLMRVGIGAFGAVVEQMKDAGAQIAACAEPSGRNLGQMISLFADPAKMAPLRRMAADARLDPALPYFSTGLFFCGSARFLQRWAEAAADIADHPLFDQNVFNVVLHRDSVPHLSLDCDEWQAQGQSLDAVSLAAQADCGRPAALVGGKNIRTLHTTSSAPGHLLIATCRLTVRDLELSGPFKLFLSEPLRLHQLQLLATFVVTHGNALLRFGLCRRATRPTEGFEFVTL